MKNTDTVLYKKEVYSDTKAYKFRFSPAWTAGDIVDIPSVVSFSDNGDVGMKMGGKCPGKNFRYNPKDEPWGGCDYDISFNLDEKTVNVYAFQAEDSSASEIISVYGSELEIEKIIDLFGWKLDEDSKSRL